MLTLEEILRRFTAPRALEPPTRATIEPLRPRGEFPPMINGLAQVLNHMANQEKRIAALERQIAELKSELHEIHPPLR